MARKITKAQFDMAVKLADKLAEVENDMDNLWFSIDSRNPADAQLHILIDMLSTVTRTMNSIIVMNRRA